MTGVSEPGAILDVLHARCPRLNVVLTLGEKGAVYADSSMRCAQAVCTCTAVDTTAAGDTFTGYFLQAVMTKRSIPDALHLAAQASAIAVGRPGAAASIPSAQEVADRMSKGE